MIAIGSLIVGPRLSRIATLAGFGALQLVLAAGAALAVQAFPGLPLIGHAAGFWASISGDARPEDFGRYPKIPAPVRLGGELDRLMTKYSNLYGDLSEPGGYSAIARDRKFGRDFLIRRADRLLFGTDFLMADQEVPHFDLFDSLNLPEDVQQKIYRGNAIRRDEIDQHRVGTGVGRDDPQRRPATRMRLHRGRAPGKQQREWQRQSHQFNFTRMPP